MIRKLGLAFAVALAVPLTVALSTPASADCHAAFFVKKTYASNEPGVVTIAIRRDANVCGGPSSVDFTTVDGSAKAGSDYKTTSGTATFNIGEPNDSQRTFDIPILDDSDAEGAETFMVVLKESPAKGNINDLGDPATVTIAANDQPAATSPPATAAPTTAPPATTAPPTTAAPAPAPASAAPTTAAPATVRPAPTTVAPPAAPTSAPVTTTTTVTPTEDTLAASEETTTTTTTEAVEDDELAAAPTSNDGGGGGAIIGILALALAIGGGIGYWLWRRAQPSAV